MCATSILLQWGDALPPSFRNCRLLSLVVPICRPAGKGISTQIIKTSPCREVRLAALQYGNLASSFQPFWVRLGIVEIAGTHVHDTWDDIERSVASGRW